MSVEFKGGAIIKRAKMYEKVLYNASNNIMTVQFDGRGNISEYAVMNKYDVPNCFYSLLSLGETQVAYHLPKRVEMQGKRQIVTFNDEQGVQVTLTQFADSMSNAVFTQYELLSPVDMPYKLVVNFGVNVDSYIREFFKSRFSLGGLMKLPKTLVFSRSKKNKKLTVSGANSYVRNNVMHDFYFDFAANDTIIPLESNALYCNQWKVQGALRAGEVKRVRYVISAGSRKDESYCDVASAIVGFDKAYAEAQEYIDSFSYPASAATEFDKAFYHSTLNCALSNYKQIGRFKGFLAGVVYQFPCRTYYRDAYWTVLPVLGKYPQLVRNEIITLSGGINKDGKCPSAVKSNFKNWWGNHYDSPSFFVLMLYDYIAHSGDKSVLGEKWRGGTIADAAVMVIEKLSETKDETGLLVKGGAYNRRDWCDNVFRMGYVTYDEALYCRALYCLSQLLSLSGDKRSEGYMAMHLQVKESINKLLWNEKLGYYNNYVNGDFVEDNLSIDTVVTVLYGIADEARARSVLSNMEKILESKNNEMQKAGDYGTMCVYPFYKNTEDVVLKSSLPYYYHNGADWPYLSAAYAYAKLTYGMDYRYPLTRWFEYNLSQGNYTPVEFYSPFHEKGSLLQAWSACGAFIYDNLDGQFFKKGIK